MLITVAYTNLGDSPMGVMVSIYHPIGKLLLRDSEAIKAISVSFVLRISYGLQARLVKY